MSFFSPPERRGAHDGYIHRAVSVLRIDRRHCYAGLPDDKKEVTAQPHKPRLLLSRRGANRLTGSTLHPYCNRVI